MAWPNIVGAIPVRHGAARSTTLTTSTGTPREGGQREQEGLPVACGGRAILREDARAHGPARATSTGLVAWSTIADDVEPRRVVSTGLCPRLPRTEVRCPLAHLVDDGGRGPRPQELGLHGAARAGQGGRGPLEHLPHVVDGLVLVSAASGGTAGSTGSRRARDRLDAAMSRISPGRPLGRAHENPRTVGGGGAIGGEEDAHGLPPLVRRSALPRRRGGSARARTLPGSRSAAAASEAAEGSTSVARGRDAPGGPAGARHGPRLRTPSPGIDPPASTTSPRSPCRPTRASRRMARPSRSSSSRPRPVATDTGTRSGPSPPTGRAPEDSRSAGSTTPRRGSRRTARLAFLSDRRLSVEDTPGEGEQREDAVQVHLLPVAGGEARRLTDLPRGVERSRGRPTGRGSRS